MRRAVLLLILPLAGCIHVAPRPISPAETAQAFEQRSLSDPALQRFVAAHASRARLPIERWDLEMLTVAAFYLHPDLDVARAEAAVAHASIATAGERPNPTLTLPVEHKAEAGFSPWIAVLGLDVPIETAGKRGLRVRRATDLSRAADLAIAQAAWQVRSEIRAQLVALSIADNAAGVLTSQSKIQNDLVEALQKRLEVGEGSRLELTRARIAAQQTALLLRDRQSQAAQARARLAAAIGVSESGIEKMEMTFDPWEISTPVRSEVRRQALVSRPDVLMSLADYAVAEDDLRLELARQYPDFHLAPGFGWDQGSQRWDLGLSATLPIFSRNRGPIAEAEARRSLSEKRFIALQGKIVGAFDAAWERYQNALKKLGDADSIVEMGKRNADAAERSFNAGEIDRIALRTAELELETARLAQTETLAEVQQSLGALEDAIEQPLTGGPMPSAFEVTR